jgi:hypothetical protein
MPAPATPQLRTPSTLPQRPAGTRGLFAEPVSRAAADPAPVAPAPSGGTSLFNRVTGAIGKRAQAVTAPPPAVVAPETRRETPHAAECGLCRSTRWAVWRFRPSCAASSPELRPHLSSCAFRTRA